MTTETCKSGRPLRHEFDGLIYWGFTQVRVVDLHNKQDTFITTDTLKETLGERKYERVMSKIEIAGFYESNNYRVEAWGQS